MAEEVVGGLCSRSTSPAMTKRTYFLDGIAPERLIWGSSALPTFDIGIIPPPFADRR